MKRTTNEDGKHCLRTSTSVDAEEVLRILERHGQQRGGLIAVLGEIQDAYGYLPEFALKIVSEKTGRLLRDIYGVATFYRSFSLVPRGKHMICACLGTACHVRGAQRIVDEIERKLGIQSGQTTPDDNFTLETVNCLGACALGPVVVTDGRYHAKVKKAAVGELLVNASSGNTDAAEVDSAFPLDVSCPRCRQKLADETHCIDQHPSIRLNATSRGRRGWIRLSSLYGSQNLDSESPITTGATVELQCPHCHISLPMATSCWQCGAQVASLLVVGGGTVSFCSRRGCDHHQLDIA
jgi:NADH:ubiquinone oxidoreductase subunit E